MLKLVVSALLVALAVADSCCTPDQWEGIASGTLGSVTNGKSISAQTTALLSYDFTDMKVAADITTIVDGMTSRNKTIIDYNKKMIYNYNEMTGDCTVSPFDQPFKKACVPDDAKQLGILYYGAGDNMLNATSYMLNRNDFTYYVSFTTAGCIPITEVAVGNMGPTATMIATGFENITPGIKNSSVFNPPPACQQAKVQHFQKSERRGLLGLHL